MPVVSLIAKTPLAGHLPVTVGTCTLAEVMLGPVTSLSPYRGREQALSDALMAAHGVAFPAPNRVAQGDGLRLVWSGRAQAFLTGAAPGAGLGDHAALTDQSDGWAGLHLSGTGAEAVLARLVPVDLRAPAFDVGHCARTQVQHINALIIRTGEQAFEIMVMRSFGQTAVHEITEAMRGVNARAAVRGG